MLEALLCEQGLGTALRCRWSVKQSGAHSTEYLQAPWVVCGAGSDRARAVCSSAAYQG